MFCFSSSFSPVNSGLFFQSWSSPILLLSIVSPSWHPPAALQHSSRSLDIRGDAVVGNVEAGAWSQRKVPPPLRTFPYWSVTVVQTTGHHTNPRLSRTVLTSGTLFCSSPNVLIQLLVLFLIDFKDRERKGGRKGEEEGGREGEREREREREQKKHHFVVLVTYAFIGCFLYVSCLGIEPATLA